jgi:hypothetical protein
MLNQNLKGGVYLGVFSDYKNDRYHLIVSPASTEHESDFANANEELSLDINGTIYNDYRLPTKEEFIFMTQEATAEFKFDRYYWTSTSYLNSMVFVASLTSIGYAKKSDSYFTRKIRTVPL